MMAGRNGKRKAAADPELGDEVEDSPSSSESSDGFGSESDREKDPEDDDIVNIDFEFFDPAEIDFHGLKSLLRTYLDGEDFSCSELVHTIIKQVLL